MAKYSIIVPVYNTEKFLTECLDSLVHQTYRDFEIIIVNDGSTDGSASVIESYLGRYENLIKVVTQENHGLLLARRAGYKTSTGEILMTVDSDDYIREDTLELVDRCFQRYDVDVVSFAFSRTPDFAETSQRKPFNASTFVGREDKQVLYQAICMTRTINFASSKAIKRSLVDVDRDYTEYDGLCCAEDLLQVLPVLDKLSSFYFIDAPLYYYRVNNDSITKHYSFRNYLDCQRVGLIRLLYAHKWEHDGNNEGLVEGSLFMSLRESCENIVRISELFERDIALRYFDEIRGGELYKISSSCRDAEKMLHPYYRLIHYLFQKERYRQLKLVSVAMLRINRMAIQGGARS